jgi:hypothetical protein
VIRPPLWMCGTAMVGCSIAAQAAGGTMPDRRAIVWMVALGFVSVLLVYLRLLAYAADHKRAARHYAAATAVRDREAASYRRMVEVATTAPCPTTMLPALPPTQRIGATR